MNMSDLIAKEGTILFPIPNISKPCETYYKTIGDLSDTSRTPLVIVHGGPGTGHAYLLPLVDLAQLYDIPLLFYDQIGCGRSTHLSETAGDITLWTEALYLRELENVLSYFGLPERGYDYFGQSWGGMMGARFAASRPKGLRRLILANAGMCMELRTKGVSTLVQELPKEIQQAIAEGQRTGDYESPEYQKATDLYFRRHLCRVEPWPCKEVLDAIKNLSDDTTAHDIM
jgi:proline-specific peptidase